VAVKQVLNLYLQQYWVTRKYQGNCA